MKKLSILPLVAIVALFMFASCNRYEAKKVTLKTQNDSLNYTLGLANGDGIKNYYMRTDSGTKAIKALIQAIDKAYKGADKDEMYQLGLQIGSAFKEQKTKGLMGDSTLKFNEDLIIQGLVNGMNGYDKGMSGRDAQEYIQKTMMRIQQSKLPKPAPAPAPAAKDSTQKEVK